MDALKNSHLQKRNLHHLESGKRKSECNLCGKRFRARSRLERICKFCKENSELYRFSEWLPHPEDLIAG